MGKITQIKNNETSIIGTNQEKGKLFNKALVFEYIRLYGPLTRMDIVMNTHLVLQTISNLVKELIDEGLVVERTNENLSPKRRGAPPTFLTVRENAKFSIGIQIQYSRVVSALINLKGDIVKKIDVDVQEITTENASFLGQHCFQVIDELMAYIPNQEDLIGIGIGLPHSFHLPFRSIDDLSSTLSERFENILIGNNAQVASIGEYWMGRGKIPSSFFYVYIGENIGAGVIQEGEGYLGVQGKAAELGHIQYMPNGIPCDCGSKGCLQHYGSPNAIRNMLNLPHSTPISEIIRIAKQGDQQYLQAIRDATRALVQSIVSALILFELCDCIIGGPHAVDLFEWIGTMLEEEIKSRKLNICVHVSELGIDAGAIGAASTVIHEILWRKTSNLLKT